MSMKKVLSISKRELNRLIRANLQKLDEDFINSSQREDLASTSQTNDVIEFADAPPEIEQEEFSCHLDEIYETKTECFDSSLDSFSESSVSSLECDYTSNDNNQDIQSLADKLGTWVIEENISRLSA